MEIGHVSGEVLPPAAAPDREPVPLAHARPHGAPVRAVRASLQLTGTTRWV